MKNTTIEEYRKMLDKNIIHYDNLLSIQNQKNRLNGRIFEEMIAFSCEFYKSQGMADIEKTPEPLHPISNVEGNKVIAVYTKKAQADFKGVLLGGKAVYFEAKSTVNDKILQNVVSPHQTESINSKYKLGCVCFVLCAVATMYYKIPWDVWVNMKELFKHKYMNQQDLQPYICKVSAGIIKFLD